MVENVNKSKIPRSVTILGRKFRVRLVNGIKYGEEYAAGLCDFNKKLILLDKNQSEEDLLVTLAHESYHVALQVVGLEQCMNNSEVETHCQVFANTFFDLALSIGKKKK